MISNNAKECRQRHNTTEQTNDPECDQSKRADTLIYNGIYTLTQNDDNNLQHYLTHSSVSTTAWCSMSTGTRLSRDGSSIQKLERQELHMLPKTCYLIIHEVPFSAIWSMFLLCNFCCVLIPVRFIVPATDYTAARLLLL